MAGLRHEDRGSRVFERVEALKQQSVHEAEKVEYWWGLLEVRGGRVRSRDNRLGKWWSRAKV